MHKLIGLMIVVALLSLSGPVIAGPYEDGLAAVQRGDYASALKLWLTLGGQGHADAQFDIGLMYKNGEGVHLDCAEAAKWFLRAADLGHAKAQFALGEMHHAMTLCREASSIKTFSQDHTVAMQWYRKAADQGHAGGQYMVGLLYAEGMGVPQNYTETVKWWRRAAESTDTTDAMTPRSVVAAHRPGDSKTLWSTYCQWLLGGMYQRGERVPQDYAEAVKWYRKAAERNHPGAKTRLGIMYRDGHGVPKDNVEAHKWFNLAAADQAELAIEYRDLVAKKMTANQIAEAQKLAREWKPTTK